MQEDIGVKIGELGYNLELDDSSRLPNYFPYRYEDEKKSITLAYYFDYQRPHPKLMTKVTIMTKSPVVTYTKSFKGHLNDTETTFQIPAYDFIKEQPGSGSIDFKLLDKPCSPSAQYSSVRKVYLKTDKGEIPVSKDILSYKDYNDLISNIGNIAGGVEKWVYGIIDKTSGAAGKCMEVVFKDTGEAASSGVKLVSSLNPALKPSVFNVPGSNPNPDFVPELIKKANANPTDKQVAAAFNTEDACKNWAKLNSVIIEYKGKIVSLSGLIYSDIDSAIGKYISAKTSGGQSECVQVKFSTAPDSSAPTPSSLSCSVTFIPDVPNINVNPEVEVPDITVLPEISSSDIVIKTVEVPADCEGYEVGSQPVASTEKRAEQIRDEKAAGLEIIDSFSRGLVKKIDKNNLRLVAVKTYDTKEKCEGPRVFVNWYPGMDVVDLGGSTGLKGFVDSYIEKIGYGGGTVDMRNKLPSESYYFSLTDKDIDVSFGWSSGGLGRGNKNAVYSTKLTYSKKPSIKKLGLFLYDPTDWDTTHSGSFDSIPIDKFPTGVILLSKSKSAWKKSGDSRLTEIDLLNEYNINVPGLVEGHFGVSDKLVKEVFALYIDGLVSGASGALIESSIRSFLEANRGYSGGTPKSSTKLSVADDKYVEAEKQYAMAELKNYIEEDLNDKSNSGSINTETLLVITKNSLECLDFAEKIMNGEYDNNAISSLPEYCLLEEEA